MMSVLTPSTHTVKFTEAIESTHSTKTISMDTGTSTVRINISTSINIAKHIPEVTILTPHFLTGVNTKSNSPTSTVK
jgi:hypothetical protein